MFFYRGTIASRKVDPRIHTADSSAQGVGNLLPVPVLKGHVIHYDTVAHRSQSQMVLQHRAVE